MNQYAPLIIVIALVILVWVIPCRWDPAIRWKEAQIRSGHHPEARPPGHPDRWKDFITEARADQAKTDYPGCARGIMNCRHTGCGCINESRPSDAFIRARAELLAEDHDRKFTPYPGSKGS